jgi:hypothetical protein
MQSSFKAGGELKKKQVTRHLLLTAETHNFPTAVVREK